MIRRKFLTKGLTTSGVLACQGISSLCGRTIKVLYLTKIFLICPNSKRGPTFVQGDSITDMKWGRNQKDRNHYLGHSYVFLLASRLGVDMAEANLEFFNRGVSGNKVYDLRKR